jgi:hypothetical protein
MHIYNAPFNVRPCGDNDLVVNHDVTVKNAVKYLIWSASL